MNADYLAKMIFHYWNETEGVEIPQTLLEDAATMLREQQRTMDGDKRLIALLYKKIEKLQSDNAELKAYNTELHGIEHDLEMKVMQLQSEIERLQGHLVVEAKIRLELVEEARKLGMQQERALWELSAIGQEIDK